MPDNNTVEDVDDKDTSADENGSASDQNNNDASSDEENNQNEEHKEEGSGEDKAKVPNDNSSQKVKEVEEDDEPKVRKTPQDFIIMRQQKKIEKLSKPKDDEEDIDESEDEEINPEDERVISRVLDKKISPFLKPLLDKQVAAENESEINAFLSQEGNEAFKPYEAKVRKYMAHPSRKAIPVEELFYSVAGKDLIKIGAERERKAVDKAKDSQSGGGSARDDGSQGKQKDPFKMTDAEFEAAKLEVYRNQRN